MLSSLSKDQRGDTSLIGIATGRRLIKDPSSRELSSHLQSRPDAVLVLESDRSMWLWGSQAYLTRLIPGQKGNKKFKYFLALVGRLEWLCQHKTFVAAEFLEGFCL